MKKHLTTLIVLFSVTLLSFCCSAKASAEECSHDWEEYDYSAATLSKDGSITYECYECGATKTSKISRPKTFQLSKTEYTYNGQEKCPTVKIWDANGKRISSDYYYMYYYNNYEIGRAQAYVEFYGKYSGTKSLYFTIKPRGTSIKKIKAQPKGFKVKWKQRGEESDGYQIQYSSDKNFSSGGKRLLIKDSWTEVMRVVKLKAKKRYYVRVRTYKKIGKKRYYSAWSKAKSVKTKTTKNKRSYCHNLETKYPGYFLCYANVRDEYPTYYDCDAVVWYGVSSNPRIKSYKTRVRISKKCRVTYFDSIGYPDVPERKLNISLKRYHQKYNCCHIFDYARMGKTKYNKKGYIIRFQDGTAE